MKHISLLLIVGFIFTSLSINAQRAKSVKVSFEYFRLPIHKTDEANRIYRVVARIPFAEDYKRDKAAHEADLIAAEEEYKEAIRIEKEKNVGEKIFNTLVLEEEGPKKRVVPDFPRRNDIPSSNQVTAKINLQGFNKVTSEGNLITLELNDYQVSMEKKHSGEGAEYREYAVVSIRQPIWVKIESADGNILYDQTTSATETAYEKSTAAKTATDYNSFMNGSGYESWLNSEKKELLTKNLEAVNEELNSQFGYSWVKKTTPIYTGAGKKMDYSDLDAAQLDAKHALLDMKIDKAKADEQMNSALKVWLKVLDEELESDNKKARINHKVGAALYINCAIGYIFLNEFDKASQVLNDVEGNSDFKKGDIWEAEALRKFLNDNRMRQGG